VKSLFLRRIYQFLQLSIQIVGKRPPYGSKRIRIGTRDFGMWISDFGMLRYGFELGMKEFLRN
jgi:hypothetical protein